ncbi:MAG: VTC domain-containing protein [Raoultibacter sp.]|jgi:hypothetical protein
MSVVSTTQDCVSEREYHVPPVSKTARTNAHLVAQGSMQDTLISSQTTARRGELKYLLDKRRYIDLLSQIRPYIEFDEHPLSQISSLYLDARQNAMVRRSLEKPRYKEKLRIRSYSSSPGPEDRCFLEIKKKYRGVVYKRRVEMSYAEALHFCNTKQFPEETLSLLTKADYEKAIQVLREVEWLFVQYGDVVPSFTVNCNRTSYKEIKTESLRITFDSDICWSHESVKDGRGYVGVPLIAPGARIMEIKSTKGLPEWLIAALRELCIYPQSFSKVGSSYREWLKQEKGC